MKMIFVRHGETVENAQGIIQGQIEGYLSKRGVLQARCVAERLRGERIHKVYTSDLSRALNTAEEIVKVHNVPLEAVPELRERKVGPFEGKKKSEIVWTAEITEVYNHGGVEGVESREEVHARVQEFLEEVYAKHRGETIVVVGHGGIGRALIALVQGSSHVDSLELERLKNCSVSIINMSRDVPVVELFNCTKHLSEITDSDEDCI